MTHESGILGALPGMFQAWIVKRIHDVISWALVRNNEIRCLDKMLEALESEKLPAEKDRAFWLMQGSAQYRVFPREMAEDMEVVLVPREEWPSHGFFGVLVVWSRSQGDDEGTRRVPNSLAGVACDIYSGGFTGVRLLGLRFVDVTPFVFQAEDGKGRTEDLCEECWLANDESNGTARSFRFEKTWWRKRGCI